MKKTRFFAILLALSLIFSISMAVYASDDSHEGAPEIIAPEGDYAPDTEEDGAAATTPARSSNTPLFVGAGIAVLMFIGVAIYCKTHGNKNL